jgi:hypothetical protein
MTEAERRLAAQMLQNQFENLMAEVGPRGFDILRDYPEFAGIASRLTEEQIAGRTVAVGLSRAPVPRSAAPKPHVESDPAMLQLLAEVRKEKQ